MQKQIQVQIAYLVVIFLMAFTIIRQEDKGLKASLQRGKEVYLGYCISCHMEDGQGIPGIFPPLANSDYLMADRDRAIQTIMYGLAGEIKVNGQVYNAEMTAQDLDDQEIADVLNYIINTWNKKSTMITEAEVAAVRK